MFRGSYHGKQAHPDDLDQVLLRAKKAGVDRMIVTAGNIDDCHAALDLVKDNDALFMTVGCHPTRCTEFESYKGGPDAYFNELKRMLENPEAKNKIVAIGECGLDYDRLHFCPKETQQKYFERQFDLAESTGLPMFLHDRNTGKDFGELITKHRSRFSNGVVHSFTGSIEEMQSYLDLGLYIGINGCSLKTEENLRVAASVPLDMLMLETDGPWCDIRPTHASHKHLAKVTPDEQALYNPPANKKERFEMGSMVKSRNEPCTLGQVLHVMASIHDIAPDALAKITYDNTVKVEGSKLAQRMKSDSSSAPLLESHMVRKKTFIAKDATTSSRKRKSAAGSASKEDGLESFSGYGVFSVKCDGIVGTTDEQDENQNHTVNSTNAKKKKTLAKTENGGVPPAKKQKNGSMASQQAVGMNVIAQYFLKQPLIQRNSVPATIHGLIESAIIPMAGIIEREGATDRSTPATDSAQSSSDQSYSKNAITGTETNIPPVTLTKFDAKSNKSASSQQDGRVARDHLWMAHSRGAIETASGGNTAGSTTNNVAVSLSESTMASIEEKDTAKAISSAPTQNQVKRSKKVMSPDPKPENAPMSSRKFVPTKTAGDDKSSVESSNAVTKTLHDMFAFRQKKNKSSVLNGSRPKPSVMKDNISEADHETVMNGIVSSAEKEHEQEARHQILGNVEALSTLLNNHLPDSFQDTAASQTDEEEVVLRRRSLRTAVRKKAVIVSSESEADEPEESKAVPARSASPETKLGQHFMKRYFTPPSTDSNCQIIAPKRSMSFADENTLSAMPSKAVLKLPQLPTVRGTYGSRKPQVRKSKAKKSAFSDSDENPVSDLDNSSDDCDDASMINDTPDPTQKAISSMFTASPGPTVVSKPRIRRELSQGSKAQLSGGLSNFSNTCYLNSVLQSLRNTIECREMFSEIQDTMSKVEQKLGSTIELTEYQRSLFESTLEVMKVLDQREKGCSQQQTKEEDGVVQEPAALVGKPVYPKHVISTLHQLDDVLQEVLKAAKQDSLVPVDGVSEEQWHPINDVFQVRTQSVAHCLKCPEVTIKEDRGIDLTVQIDIDHPSLVRDLNWGIMETMKMEHMKEDNQRFCEKCATKEDAHVYHYLKSLPKVLILRLQRYNFREGAIKLQNSVSCAEELNFREWMCKDFQGPDPRYELCAVIIHRGRVITSGHYYTYIRKTSTIETLVTEPNGVSRTECDTYNWLKYNDSIVEPVSDKEMAKVFSGDVSTSVHSLRVPAPVSEDSSPKKELAPYLDIDAATP
ncbi:TatD DNase, partial [Podila humilis]